MFKVCDHHARRFNSLKRLYVCSQFVIINCMLRRHPADLYAAFAGGGNRLDTTAHVLASAVAKLARSAGIPTGARLYRGLAGLAELPGLLGRADGGGPRGFAELGFLSATGDVLLAARLGRTGAGGKRPVAAAVLVIRVGAVGGGACVREFSQYPQALLCSCVRIAYAHAWMFV